MIDVSRGKALRVALTAAVLFAAAAAAVFAGGAGEKTDANGGAALSSGLDEGASVVLEGRVKSKGNEPFAWAALETDDGMFKLVGPRAEELYREHQLERVRIRGTVVTAGTPPLLPPEIDVKRFRPAE